MQLIADLILKPDKRFKDDLLLCLINGLVQCRVVVISIFQQLDAVTFPPAKFHRWISALKGA